ncbi:MAG: hypothetical protein JW896_01430 [Deltaproteobacteria bacterium]|nr:hypothetical protein [Deltaproteobacteria bacterium]
MGVDGIYQVTTNTPMGKMESTLTLITDGDSLSGSSASAMMGTVEFSGGKVDGNNFTFQMTLNTPMGKMEMTNNGSVDGDNISGEVRSSMGNMAYSGVRV